MTKEVVYFVAVEHFSVPGVHQSIHRDAGCAVAKLCESLAIVVNDHNKIYGEDDSLPSPTHDNWEEVIAALENCHGAAYVSASITPLTLED